jgi:probable HAF family extracellular repeat protein
MRNVAGSLAAVTALGLIGSRPALCQSYSIKGLKGLGSATSIAAISNLGRVLGARRGPGRVKHVLFWQDGKVTDLGPVAQADTDDVYPIGLNDCDQVLVQAGSSSDHPHGFVWESGNWIPLGEIAPAGINNLGQVVGSALAEGGRWRPILWEQGNRIELPVPSGRLDCMAECINDRGRVAGFVWPEDGNPSAVLWEHGQLIPLPTPHARFGATTAINHHGQVVGYLDETPVLWDQGQVVRLGDLGGGSGWAADINDTGQVIGRSRTASGGYHPFLWHQGRMRDLNHLIPMDTGWKLENAVSINDHGQIVGYGYYRDRPWTFLLTPLHPQPSAHGAYEYGSSPAELGPQHPSLRP